MQQVRLAVVGAGRQSTKMLMPGIPGLEEIDLVAICDLQAELAQRNARNFGARAWYTDVAKMLEQEAPDAVMVVGPPQIHEEIGLQVLHYGAHLFVEKPIAPTLEGALRLVDAARKAGKFGQVGHMMRHADPVRIAWDIAHAEEFGEILSIESRYTTWPTPAFPPGAGWGDSDEDWSYMLNQGGHPIDLLHHFLGPIARVSAVRSHGRGSAKVYQVAVEGENGRAGFLNLQDSFNGWTTGLEVVGDKKAVVTVDQLGKVTYQRGEKRVQAEQDTWGNSAYTWEPHHTLANWARSGYGNELRFFAQCILEGRQPYPSLYDGYRNLLVGRCIIESYQSHQTVAVPKDEQA